MRNSKLLMIIKKMAHSKNWEVRESAAENIKKLNDKNFQEYLPIWKKWVRDRDPKIRRAVEVGLLRISKRHYKEALNLLVPLLADNNVYVRKNCGPFALSAVAFRNPKDAFHRFRKLIKTSDQNVRWNIAMCLGVMFGVKYPEQSMKLLRILVKDKRRFVWRAATSSLIKLLRKYPQYRREIYSWRKNEHILTVIQKYS